MSEPRAGISLVRVHGNGGRFAAFWCRRRHQWFWKYIGMRENVHIWRCALDHSDWTVTR